MTQDMINRAKAVLRQNDRGTYTVPTHGLYPFQWNWDSALSAIGFAHFDEARAWTHSSHEGGHRIPRRVQPKTSATWIADHV